MSQPLVDTTDTVFVRSMQDSDREKVEQIYHNRWGEVHDEALDDALAASVTDVGLVAAKGPKVIGFLTLFIRSPADIEEWVNANIDWSPANEIGYVQMVCVDRMHEGQRAATLLLQRAIRYCTQMVGVDYMAAVCWHRDGHRDSRRLFEQQGFHLVKEIERYYWTAGEKRTTCPDCPGICTCDASVYARQVEDKSP